MWFIFHAEDYVCCLALSFTWISFVLGLHLLAIYVDICLVWILFVCIFGYAIYIHLISREQLLSKCLCICFSFGSDQILFESNDEFKVFVQWWEEFVCNQNKTIKIVPTNSNAFILCAPLLFHISNAKKEWKKKIVQILIQCNSAIIEWHEFRVLSIHRYLSNQ